MKTVTLEKVKTFEPCWLNSEEGIKLINETFKRNDLTALDVLNSEQILAKDKLIAVLREDFISSKTLDEFACRCVERALKLAGGNSSKLSGSNRSETEMVKRGSHRL